MKTLYLVRHAKATLEKIPDRDIDRQLLEKGLKRTKYIIDFLLKKKTKVDLIISSPAVRAYDTARAIAHALKYPLENIKKERALYEGDADKIEDLFYDLPHDIDRLMIVGHNPAITNFANQLLPEPIDYLPTSGIVCLQFDTNIWDEIMQAKIIANFVVTPRMLKKDEKE
ncbi:MAG: histidine phosphatase family protein [Bacteroidota bacterium]|nr:histidine phosphatase family protein [Bacteroidota bacterium]